MHAGTKYRWARLAASTASFIGRSVSSGEVAALETRGDPMTTTVSRAAACAFASLFLISSAFAQTAAPAAPAPGATASPAAKKAEKPRTVASLECSKEADTKGVHGKERKKFMSECKKAAKASSAKTKS